MLISKIPDNVGGKGESGAVPEEESVSHEYQTANELFELMAKNQNFDSSNVDKLTTRDLVLLYKNIDLGTKLMSNTNDLKRKKPNQHVENIVYNDEPESDSDVSDKYSSEDLRSVFLANNERLDLLNAPPSAENTLCHKLGDLQIQTSNLATEYDKHFLFNDPYIKEQLKIFKLMNKSSHFEDAVLPASLLDYICCKRLEDNYNFYMDNIIRYVKNTIDQLKRISNGDYLSDKAREKWREVESTAEDLHGNTKVLATSTSIPLHVERKISGRNITWDDIIHSAVDIRSISKILEKKIVVEVPKLLCGPYKLLSKYCAENLIISCKNDEQPVEERVDVVFQLQRSETGLVISNINSIMILQSTPVEHDTLGPEMLPLTLSFTEQANGKRSPENKPKIIELEQITNEIVHEVSLASECSIHSSENPIEDSILYNINYGCSNDDLTESLKNSSYQVSSGSSDALKDILEEKLMIAQREASRGGLPDDLRMTIRKLTMQGALTEESGEDLSQSTSKKKRSPTRVRIKSPYENQSYIMEEKKRKKLLEIRERRERKKMALTENCKIIKHKYTKGTTLPQSASSVTKLSISNKSFYNSIYGQNPNVDPNKQGKERNQKGGKRDVSDMNMDGNEGEHDVSAVSTPDKNSKKYINRSYYLDDAVTEMMYINMKQNENDVKDLSSVSTSIISSDIRNNLNYLSQLIGPSESDLNIGDDEMFTDKVKLLTTQKVCESVDESASKQLLTFQGVLNKVPSNSPHVDDQDNTEPKKLTSVECRKSIDKIYSLMNKLGKAQEADKSTKSKLVVVPKKVDEKEIRMSSTCQGSESGTSMKHRITSSNPSSFSFDKNNTERPNNTHNKKPGSLSPVVPKVIISSKSSPTPKPELEINRKTRRRSGTSPTTKVAENPLKAISQLLHEFENVQKTKQKPNTEQKHAKKIDIVSNDGKSIKSGSRKGSLKRRSRIDKHNEFPTERYVRLSTPRDKLVPKDQTRQHKEMDSAKIPYQQSAVDDKHTERLPRKKMIEILDEAKEARGEAVRGPSKLNSRLNSLAQPKRSYVQAHSEEYQTKYGKTLMADRLQRLASAPPLFLERPKGSANIRNKVKRSGSEAVPAVGALNRSPSPVPPSENRRPMDSFYRRSTLDDDSKASRSLDLRFYNRVFRRRHSPSNTHEAKETLKLGMGSSYKQVVVPETPQVLKKKMVAVESYLKNHYGQTRPISPTSSDIQSAHKSRVPLLPNDIELASSTSSAPFHESSELGSRLHTIISSIMKTTASQGLEVLAENPEIISLDGHMSSIERPSSDSDYTVNTLDNNNVMTTVQNIDNTSEKNQKHTNIGKTCAVQSGLQSVRSATESGKLENAICNPVPVGTFQKRLRIKNLTMTPKQSMQQIFVLQSGDASSLVVQTPMAQNMNEKTVKNFSDLTALPILSKSHLDWRFSNFPMKFSTVNYAFPGYKSTQRSSNSLVQLFDEVPKKMEEKQPEKPLLAYDESVKDSHISKGAQPTLRFEQAAQVNFSAPTVVTVGISTTCNHIMESEKEQEMKQGNASNAEPKLFTDFSQNNKMENKLNGEQTQTDTVIGNEDNVPVLADKPDDIEYTTSLDILVGLLNEIQNITTCQTQITKCHKSDSENQQSKILETILINETAAAPEYSMRSSNCDLVSLTSLERLRQLESNPSLYSFYLSDNEGSEKGSSQINFPSEIITNYTNELWCPKRVYVDKEVGADFIDREAVSKFTDVPSQLLSLGTSPSTNVTKSSIQSMFFAECPLVDSNAESLEHKSVINIPHILVTRESKQSLDFYDVKNQLIEMPKENKSHVKIIESFEKVKIKNMRKVNNGEFSFKTEFDPILKMKRDILVTVYSILVFTVFAALSFPEMLYRI